MAYKTTPTDPDMMHGNPLHTFAKKIFVPSLGTECPFPDKDSTPELCIQDVGKLEQCRASILLRGHRCFSISCDKSYLTPFLFSCRFLGCVVTRTGCFPILHVSTSNDGHIQEAGC